MVIRRTALVFGFCTGLAGCATIPGTGEKKLILVSQEQEKAMGAQAAEEIAQSMPLYPDEKVQRYVSELGLRLAKLSESPNLPWSFKVIDDPAVNAFALPGGYIFVTRGILTHMSSEAQLASVLGHEIGHVTGRHGAQNITKAMGAQLALGAALVVSDTARQFAEPLAGLTQLVTLRWGRDAEREADMLGFRYARKGNYDMGEMGRVFETLKRVSDEAAGGQRLPDYLATHPDPGERAEAADKRTAEAKKEGAALGTEVGRDQYLRMIDGMIFGENPRQGFFQGSAFKHPEMKFTFEIPQGWKGQNLSEAVVAQNEAGDGAAQLTVAGKMAPDEALRTFLGKEIMQDPQPLPRGLSTAVPSASGRFMAKTEGGVLAGVVSFYSHSGTTFQLLTLTKPERFAALEPVFQRVHGSFAPLTEPAALAVQPARLKVQPISQAKSVEEIKRDSSSPVSTSTLAIINQVAPGATLPAGALVKTVQGTLPPGSAVAGK